MANDLSAQTSREVDRDPAERDEVLWTVIYEDGRRGTPHPWGAIVLVVDRAMRNPDADYQRPVGVERIGESS